MTIAQMKGYAPGAIIKKDKTLEFIKRMNATVPSKEFWDECRTLRESMTPDAIAKMNALMDAEA